MGTFFLALLAVIVVLAILFFSLFNFTQVDEGTGVAFKALGAYAFTIMNLKNKHFDGEIIKDGHGVNRSSAPWFYDYLVPQILGWVFYPRRVIETTRYLDQNNADGFGEDDIVFLNDRQVVLQISGAEDNANTPLDLKGFVKLRVRNPYLFLFMAPENVIAMIVDIIVAAVRLWVRESEYKVVQASKKNVWDILMENPNFVESIKSILDDWGVEVVPKSIAFPSIDLRQEDQDAKAAETRQNSIAVGAAKKWVGIQIATWGEVRGLDYQAAVKELQKPENATIRENLVALANQRAMEEMQGAKRVILEGSGGELERAVAIGASLLGGGSFGSGSVGGGGGSTSTPRKGDSGGKKPEKFTGDEQGEGESDEDYLDRMSK